MNEDKHNVALLQLQKAKFPYKRRSTSSSINSALLLCQKKGKKGLTQGANPCFSYRMNKDKSEMQRYHGATRRKGRRCLDLGLVDAVRKKHR